MILRILLSFLLCVCFSLPLNAQTADTNQTVLATTDYDTVMKSVTESIAQNKFSQAIATLDNLERFYPDNTELISRRAALYYWTRAYRNAIEEYEKLYRLTHDPIYLQHKDKVVLAMEEPLYTEKKNFLSLQRETYSYGGKQPLEKDTTLQGGFKSGDMTWIASFATIDRYNTPNQQIGIEAYSRLGSADARRWGYLSIYQSPDASFLPKWDYAGAIYQGILSATEISLGYRHMSFKTKEVDIFKPGVSFPLPYLPVQAQEDLYLVPDTHSYASVTTLSYDHSYRIGGYYTFTVGNSAETFRDETDIRRVRTLSHALGGKWRFDPSWAVGAEITDGFRSQLYRRSGGKIWLKYFW